MHIIEEEKAQFTTLDAGELFTAGRFHSLVPILQELYNGNRYKFKKKCYHLIFWFKK